MMNIEGNLKGACIIGQSGGPSAVINASALGAIQAAMDSDLITHVYGAEHGIKGVLNDRLFDLEQEDAQELELLMHTPSSFLGSCRYKLKEFSEDETDYLRILDIFKKYDVRYFFYIGGNDSMDTCNKISKYMENAGYDCRIMGIPKTIDNDLYGTDHTPGYGSAAKYIASTCREIKRDAVVYDTGAVTILEIMGRNAGWLTGAAALAGYNAPECGVDLIYLPEVEFDIDNFVDDVISVLKKNGNVIVAVSEGVKDKYGALISEYSGDTAKAKDAFGHAQLGGLAATLTSIVKARTGKKVRGIEFSLLQRCSNHIASATDAEEAYAAGKAAVEFALSGVTDKMVGFERVMVDGKYTCQIKLLDLTAVANREQRVPRSWINEAGNGVTDEFIEYALPLIQGELDFITENGMPRHARLKKILTK